MYPVFLNSRRPWNSLALRDNMFIKITQAILWICRERNTKRLWCDKCNLDNKYLSFLCVVKAQNDIYKPYKYGLNSTSRYNMWYSVVEYILFHLYLAIYTMILLFVLPTATAFSLFKRILRKSFINLSSMDDIRFYGKFMIWITIIILVLWTFHA